MIYLFLLVGFFIGSFLGVLVYRIPNNKPFIKGRSYCENCKHVLGFWDLVPVLSFVFLKGKCRYCKHRLSLIYPVIELTTALIFFLLVLFFQNTPIFLFYYLIISCFLIIVLFTDYKYGIIPDKITATSLLVVSFYLLFFSKADLINHLLSAILASGLILLISYIYFLVRKKDSMGGGDIKLIFFMGLFLGFPNIVVALYLAFLTAAIYSIILIIWRKKGLANTIPFGPFLVCGTWISMFLGNLIAQKAFLLLGI